MEKGIKTEGIDPDNCLYNKKGIAVKELLIGELTGVSARYVSISPGCTLECAEDCDNYHIIFFTGGSGYAKCNDKAYEIWDMAVFVPALHSTFAIESVTGITYLEIIYKIGNSDNKGSNEKNSSYFLEYSKCPTYKEAIKSRKTINRTILEADRIPRFCMGSVETGGKDIVQAHSHPMVEQLFFGLPGNSCIVTANGDETYFGENILLHIPSASTHGVTVDEGNHLHYIWFDFFKDDDMSYIKENHYTNDRP